MRALAGCFRVSVCVRVCRVRACLQGACVFAGYLRMSACVRLPGACMHVCACALLCSACAYACRLPDCEIACYIAHTLLVRASVLSIEWVGLSVLGFHRPFNLLVGRSFRGFAFLTPTHE